MNLTPLGTNGFIPSFGRHTMSFLLLTDDQAIVLDAGTGLARLLEPEIQRRVQPYSSLNILLSHYHLDHVVGLSYLPAVWPAGTVSIYGPGPPFVETQPDAALDQLLSPPLFGAALRDFPARVSVTAVREEELTLGGISISFRAQKHPGGSVGMRLADSVVYMTDTVVDPEAESFLRGADLLLHEVWATDEEARATQPELAGHSFAGGVADLAVRSGVKRVMPVHFHPKRSNKDLRKLARQMTRDEIEIVLPREGETYVVD